LQLEGRKTAKACGKIPRNKNLTTESTEYTEKKIISVLKSLCSSSNFSCSTPVVFYSFWAGSRFETSSNCSIYKANKAKIQFPKVNKKPRHQNYVLADNQTLFDSNLRQGLF